MNPLLSLTDADVQAICRHWQARLRLQDWDIHCELVRGFRLTDAVAEIETLDTKRTAWVRVMHPADYNPSFLLPHDPERSIVHELLHLVLRPLAPENESLAEEQVVHALSGTLVTLHRIRPDLAPTPSPTLISIPLPSGEPLYANTPTTTSTTPTTGGTGRSAPSPGGEPAAS